MYVTINININGKPKSSAEKSAPPRRQSNPVPKEAPPRVDPVPPYEGVLIDHDQLFEGNYCKLHKKTFANIHSHKDTKKHKEIEALIKGGEQKAKLSIQDMRDLFEPEPSVRRCCLCNLKFESWTLFKSHMKSPLHATTMVSFSHVTVIDDDPEEVVVGENVNRKFK